MSKRLAGPVALAALMASMVCLSEGHVQTADPIGQENLNTTGHPSGTQTESWSSYGGSPGGSQFSPLTQINLTNVERLEVAWSYHTGDIAGASRQSDPTTFEANPILVNDALYICSAFNRVIALEPDTGREIWAFDPQADLTHSRLGANICRGVSYWEDAEAGDGEVCKRRVFEGTGDGRLIALDADTGDLCRDFGDQGELSLDDFDYIGTGSVGLTSPPAIYDNMVIIGSAFQSYSRSDAPNGTVRAFDARTGKQAWAWNPIPEPLRRKVGGLNVWAPMSVDTDRNLVFLPTTSPTPDPYGRNRTLPIPFANSVVALDADSGEVVWHFQTVHHDLFDYDLPAQPMLVTIEQGDLRKSAVVQVTKMGFIYVFDRETGAPFFPVEERSVPQSRVPGEASSPTQPFPVLPNPVARQQLVPEEAWGLTFWDRGRCRAQIEKLRHDGLYTPPSLEGSVQIPNLSGGINWGGAAFDPAANLLVVNATNIAYSTRLYKREDVDYASLAEPFAHTGEMVDTPYVWKSAPLLSPLGMPCNPPPWGTLTAINLGTGATLWQVPLGRMSFGPFKSPRAWGSPNVGGPIVTGGGVVFIGATMDSRFHAFDLSSGREVWSAPLPAPGMATPMTYQFGDPPRQYIVIAAGGHAAAGTELADAVIAFALPLKE